MSFPARYPGRCPSCGERIHVDDPVRFVTIDDRRVVHDTCGGLTPETPPAEHPVCTVCWLTHPPGACDR